MKWLRRLFGLCEHKWKNIEKIDMFYVKNGKRLTECPYGYKYILQCDHCGDVKSVEVCV